MVILDLSTWLTSEEIGTNDLLIKFVDMGQHVDKEFENGKKTIFEITICLPSGDNRKWTMNKTSQRVVGDKYGANTANWIGKSVSLYSEEKNVRGTEKQVIYVRKEQENTNDGNT